MEFSLEKIRLAATRAMRRHNMRGFRRMTLTEKGVHDIFDALHRIRVSFRAAGLEVPAAIVLKTHEDGMRFLSAVRDSHGMIYTVPSEHYNPVEHPDGSIWMEAEFVGMKIHWPANLYATQAGGYVYG